MQKLYGHDIWEGFEADPNAEIQGWAGDHHALGWAAGLPGDKVVIDVGVWKGQSTINMAQSMKTHNIDGCVIAIDTFLGSPEHWDWTHYFNRVNGRPNLYEIFMSNAMKADVTDYIVPMPQTSVTAAQILRSKQIYPTVVHVDAAHEYEEVLRDCEEYFDLLIPGGYLIGDDYFSGWPGVVRAVGEFSAKVMRPIAVDGPKFIIQK
jgi:hypothetical protein